MHLLFEKLLRALGTLAFARECLFDQRVQQCFDHAQAAGAIPVLVGNAVDAAGGFVFRILTGAAYFDQDVAGQPIEDFCLVGRAGHGRRQHAGLFGDLAQLWAGEQRLAHEVELGIRVLIDRQVLDDRLDGCARVDEHTGARFIAVRQRENHEPADHGDHHGHAKREPAETPGAPQLFDHVFDGRIHGLKSGFRGRPARLRA